MEASVRGSSKAIHSRYQSVQVGDAVVRRTGAEARQGHRGRLRSGRGHSGPTGMSHAANGGDDVRIATRGVAGNDDVGTGGFPAGESRLVSTDRIAVGEEGEGGRREGAAKGEARAGADGD